MSIATSQKQYKVHIEDREYNSWVFLDPDTNKPKQLTESESIINPAQLKLFSDDMVDLSTPIPTVIHSPTKTSVIPGILILAENQTYGRTANNKRLLYKCIPNNPYLPAFLVPYSPEINFLKTQKNRYVVFRFDNWQTKYPHGILLENLGEVSCLTAFYEYQLYCRNIHSKINGFTTVAKKSLKLLPELKALNYRFFEDLSPTHRRPRIFSIDPEGAKDFDDAFSIMMHSPFVAMVRVYIANVFAWMETLNLWTAFGERVSTIYLPDAKRPMLPSILSDTTCSLVADNIAKPAFCMELMIDVNNRFIIPHSISFFNQPVKVERNYVYDRDGLLEDADYQLLHKCTALLDPSIENSHDVVKFWMIQMNSICGNRLHQKGVGIFREVTSPLDEERDIPTEELSLNTRLLLQNWKNVSGSYKLFDGTKTIPHSIMKKEHYVHITSPIRRLVDLLNLIVFQKEFGLVERISREAEDFLQYWQSHLAEINRQMYAIKKVQIDCDLLCRFTAHPEWMQHHHRGIIFDRTERPDGIYAYMVHLPELNILGRFVSQEKYVNYIFLDFKVFVFQDSDKIKRKIRMAVV